MRPLLSLVAAPAAVVAALEWARLFSGASPTTLTGALRHPGSRVDAATATDGERFLFLFGGISQEAVASGSRTLQADLWVFDAYTQEWTLLGSPLPLGNGSYPCGVNTQGQCVPTSPWPRERGGAVLAFHGASRTLTLAFGYGYGDPALGPGSGVSYYNIGWRYTPDVVVAAATPPGAGGASASGYGYTYVAGGSWTTFASPATGIGGRDPASPWIVPWSSLGITDWPAPRAWPASAVRGHSLYVVGGVSWTGEAIPGNGIRTLLNDVWRLHMGCGAWTQVVPATIGSSATPLAGMPPGPPAVLTGAAASAVAATPVGRYGAAAAVFPLPLVQAAASVLGAGVSNVAASASAASALCSLLQSASSSQAPDYPFASAVGAAPSNTSGGCDAAAFASSWARYANASGGGVLEVLLVTGGLADGYSRPDTTSLASDTWALVLPAPADDGGLTASAPAASGPGSYLGPMAIATPLAYTVPPPTYVCTVPAPAPRPINGTWVSLQVRNAAQQRAFAAMSAVSAGAALPAAVAALAASTSFVAGDVFVAAGEQAFNPFSYMGQSFARTGGLGYGGAATIPLAMPAASGGARRRRLSAAPAAAVGTATASSMAFGDAFVLSIGNDIVPQAAVSALVTSLANTQQCCDAVECTSTCSAGVDLLAAVVATTSVGWRDGSDPTAGWLQGRLGFNAAGGVASPVPPQLSQVDVQAVAAAARATATAVGSGGDGGVDALLVPAPLGRTRMGTSAGGLLFAATASAALYSNGTATGPGSVIGSCALASGTAALCWSVNASLPTMVVYGGRATDGYMSNDVWALSALMQVMPPATFGSGAGAGVGAGAPTSFTLPPDDRGVPAAAQFDSEFIGPSMYRASTGLAAFLAVSSLWLAIVVLLLRDASVVAGRKCWARLRGDRAGLQRLEREHRQRVALLHALRAPQGDPVFDDHVAYILEQIEVEAQAQAEAARRGVPEETIQALPRLTFRSTPAGPAPGSPSSSAPASDPPVAPASPSAAAAATLSTPSSSASSNTSNNGGGSGATVLSYLTRAMGAHSTVTADVCGEECAICLVEWADGDVLRRLPCGHFFHMACIDRWLRSSSKYCPFCKGNVMVGAVQPSPSRPANQTPRSVFQPRSPPSSPPLRAMPPTATAGATGRRSSTSASAPVALPALPAAGGAGGGDAGIEMPVMFLNPLRAQSQAASGGQLSTASVATATIAQGSGR